MNKKNKDSVFIDLLKKHTNIDEDFINIFFTKFKIGGELNFEIDYIDVAKYLGISPTTLKKRLNNVFSKTNKYIENVDFVKVKTGKTSGVSYMINYECMEKLAMSGDSENSETIRLYFIKLRKFIVENQHLIYQAMENKDELDKYSGMEVIYFFAVDDREMDWKVGRTIDIIRRLRNYNVGRIKEVDLKYLAVVKNSKLIEKCVGLKLKKIKL
jgi:phage anti-repressor protein